MLRAAVFAISSLSERMDRRAVWPGHHVQRGLELKGSLNVV
jgi:hypothetical protein